MSVNKMPLRTLIQPQSPLHPLTHRNKHLFTKITFNTPTHTHIFMDQFTVFHSHSTFNVYAIVFHTCFMIQFIFVFVVVKAFALMLSFLFEKKACLCKSVLKLFML